MSELAQTADAEDLQQSLIRIATALSSLEGGLPEAQRADCAKLVSVLRKSVIPQLDRDCPLLVAVTGGGSSGKSTVFNALAGMMASASDPRAGYTRRMVAAIHPKVVGNPDMLSLLFERFRENARPREISDSTEAQTAGEPVYVPCASIPERLVLLDTPDFDTGTAEGFTNRGAATEILSVSDVFLYLVTNQTYNNRASTEYIREILSGIGPRKVALLYRCFPAFGDDVVRAHMQVLLSNLYGDGKTAREACIGIWRIDESNEVAAGTSLPTIRPVGGTRPLPEALAALDPTQTRTDILCGAIRDALRNARAFFDAAGTQGRKYAVYRDALRILTDKAIRDCLDEAPQREILRLFCKEWDAAKPWLVRNGQGLSRETKEALGRVGRWVKNRLGGSAVQTGNRQADFASVFRKKFREKAGQLQAQASLPSLEVAFDPSARGVEPFVEALGKLSAVEGSSFRLYRAGADSSTAVVARPPSLLLQKTGNLEEMVAAAEQVVGDMPSIRPEIQKIVRDIRSKMSWWKKAGEWFTASLDTVALVGAISWVVATGDAVTGGTLISMFGVNDLVVVPSLAAFIAIHSGFDTWFVEKKMEKLFTLWTKEKVETIRPIVLGGITGSDIDACDRKCSELAGTVARAEGDLVRARECHERLFGTTEPKEDDHGQ